MATLYIAYNGAIPTTNPLVSMATGSTTKTLLQVLTPATMRIKVVEWGISFDGSAAAAPIKCELFYNDTAATAGTSFTPQPYDDPNGPASLCVGGTGATGYGTFTENTVANLKYGDVQLVAPTNQYIKQWPLGREFQVPVSKSLRIRVLAGTTVNAYCYVVWEE